MRNLHEVSCACCSGLTTAFDRRYFVRAIGVGAATLAFAPYFALAAEGDYEAMVLACIDPRMQEPAHRYTVEQNLTGKFSQFVIAGAAIGVVAPAFKDWHKAFWDNLATTIQLHRIKKVIAIDHRDCGAARIAYGEASIATPQAETQTHRVALAEFRKQVKASSAARCGNRLDGAGRQDGNVQLNRRTPVSDSGNVQG